MGGIDFEFLRNAVNGTAHFIEWILRIVRFFIYDIVKGIILTGWNWFWALRFWSQIALGVAIAGFAVFAHYYFKLGWAQVIAKWFRSSSGVEATTFTLLLIMGLVYWKFPSLFAPILTTCFASLLIIFMFELNKSKLEREGQNHWALFSIFILPILPVLFTFFEVSNKIVHVISTSLYLGLIATLMATNPNTVFQPRLFTQGTIYIVSLLIVLALVVVLFNNDVLSLDWSSYLSRIGMLFVTCTLLALSVALAIRFFASNPTWSVRYLIMLFILIVAGAIVVSAVFKRLPNKSYFSYFSTANLALKYVVLLSCYVSDLFAAIVAEPLQTWSLLLLEIALIIWYIFSKQLFTKTREGGAGGLIHPTGTMVQNEPITLRNETLLPISQNFKYNYAISCWIYLDAQSPNSSPEATDYTNVISYGGRPAVEFNASTNTLRITMRSPGVKSRGMTQATNVLSEFMGESLPAETDSVSGPIDMLVADIPNVALQKWIHLVLFYNSTGMLDIFINGSLYKSVAAIVTNESSGLTIGAYKGNGGKIANVMFFQGSKTVTDAFFTGGDAIDSSTVHSLYNDFKSKDPPVVNRVFPVTNPFAKETKSVSTTAQNASATINAGITASNSAIQTAVDPNQEMMRRFGTTQ